MNFKMNKAVFLLISMFLMSALAASAEVSGIAVKVTPSSAVTTDTLICSFQITGNESTYTGNVTWLKDGSDYTTQEFSASQGQEKTVTLSSTFTTKGDGWACRVSSEGQTESSNIVTIKNSPPKITSSAVKTAAVDEIYRYTVKASDADGDDLVYSLLKSPTGMNINVETGAITWTPNDNQSGSQSVSVQVTDGLDVATQDFTIRVSENKLQVNDISASCSPSCDDDGLSASGAMRGDAGSIRNVRPGSTLTLKVRVENTWPDNTDNHDIEDVQLDCTLESIGDSDEIDEDVDFGRLDPDERSSRESMEFDISKDADDGETYTISCNLQGDDQDGTNYDIDFDVDVEVEKENHDVEFTRAVLNPSTVSCNRNFDLSYEIQNLGSRDEDDVQVVIRNDALDLFKNELLTDTLQEGSYDDEDTMWSTDTPFSISDDVPPGTYPIHMEVFYNNGHDSNVDIENLVVTDCVTPTQPTQQPTTPSQPTTPQQPVQVIQQPTQPQQVTVAQPTTTTVSNNAFEEFTNSIWFVVLLAFIVLVLLALVVWMVVSLVRR